jgi:hypothetical protein
VNAADWERLQRFLVDTGVLKVAIDQSKLLLFPSDLQSRPTVD